MNILWFGKTGEANAWYHISLTAEPELVNNVKVIRYKNPARIPESNNVEIIESGDTGSFFKDAFKLMKCAYSELRKGNEDVIITFNVFPYGFMAYILSLIHKKKLILCFIGADFNSHFQSQPYKSLILKALHFADIIICKGHHMTQGLIEAGVDNEKLAYYPHFVSDKWFVEPGNNQKKYDIINVCELIERKRVDVLLYALKILKDRGISLKTCIVGDGPELEKLKSLANDLQLNSNVDFVGFKKDVLKYLKQSRIFVQTSKGEGLSLSLMESLAAGLVPVCTVAGSEKDIITHDSNGLFIEIGDPDDLAEKLMYLQDSKVYERIQQQVLKDRQQFTLSHAGKKMNKILKKIG